MYEDYARHSADFTTARISEEFQSAVFSKALSILTGCANFGPFARKAINSIHLENRSHLSVYTVVSIRIPSRGSPAAIYTSLMNVRLWAHSQYLRIRASNTRGRIHKGLRDSERRLGGGRGRLWRLLSAGDGLTALGSILSILLPLLEGSCRSLACEIVRLCVCDL